MSQTWLQLLWEVSLTLAVILSTIFSLILVTLPTRYDPYEETPFRARDLGIEEDDGDAAIPKRLRRAQGDERYFFPATSVAVFVLGDIGRSPRMQYHALSIANYGGRVDLVGYNESPLLPEIQRHKLINVVSLKKLPRYLHSGSRALFPLIAPLKVLFQTWSIYYALAYKANAQRYMLLQVPPSIPALLLAQVVCLLRNSSLVVDWHNLGHTLLGLKLGQTHALVKASEFYDKAVARYAYKHLTVSRALSRWLSRNYRVEARVLHDRPAKQFQIIDKTARNAFLRRLPETSKYADEIIHGSRRLVVSSTSWTPDEDFSILLDALVEYSSSSVEGQNEPAVTVIITGKGPLKEMYMQKVAALNAEDKLGKVEIITAWLSIADYALLLGAADLGVSLHTSSSGLDLPMKVVDMFGAGLPVVGWDDFEAWDELVLEGVNGKGFRSAAGLAQLLKQLLGNSGSELATLRQGAREESKRRWDEEWKHIAEVFSIRP